MTDWLIFGGVMAVAVVIDLALVWHDKRDGSRRSDHEDHSSSRRRW